MRPIRVLFGYALACLAAAVTLVLFVYTPAELAGLPPNGERLLEASTFALSVTRFVAVYAALPALIAVGFGEARGIGAWIFYVLAGVVIAALGFMVQYATEAPDQPTILRNYALTAFLTAGLVGGLVYWLFSGRAARRPGPGAPQAAAAAPNGTAAA